MDSRFNQSMDQATGHKTKEMLCVPIIDTEGTALGAIQIVNSHTGRSFTKQDEDLLRSFRGYIQITIMNQKQHLVGLANLMEMDAGNIDLAFLSDRVVQLTRADRGTIFIKEENQDGSVDLTFIVDSASGKKELRMPYTSKSIAGTAMIYNEVINIPDWWQPRLIACLSLIVPVCPVTKMSDSTPQWTRRLASAQSRCSACPS